MTKSNGSLRGQKLTHYTTRTLLCDADQTPYSFFLVISGGIELLADNKEGRELVIFIIRPLHWGTWLTVFDSRPAGHAFIAQPRSQIAAFQIEVMRELFDRNPRCYPQIINLIGHRFRALLQRTRNMHLAERERTVARMLLSLIDIVDSQTGGVTLAIGRQTLANLIGCSRQTLHDNLLTLAAENLVRLSYNRIQIANCAMLEAYAERTA